MALKSQPTTLHPPKSRGGSRPPGKKQACRVGPKRRCLPAPTPFQAPPFQRPEDLGSREALHLTRVCDLGWLLLFWGPTTLYRKWLIDQVFSIQLSLFNPKPCSLSSARESETGPQGVRWPRPLTERDRSHPGHG